MLERRDIARLGTIFIIAAVVVLLIIWRYVSLMLLTPDDIRSRSNSAVVERGPILDRNGRVLAMQTKLDSVTAWIPDIDDPGATANLLAVALGMRDDDIRSTFSDRQGFAYIKRKISNTEADAVRTLIDSGLTPGIQLIAESTRTYPEQQTAASLLGIVDIDNRGLEGLELEYDEILSPAAEDASRGDVYGNQLFLTIDLHLQYAAERLAAEAAAEQKADSVMILAMDARTGEMLAMAGTPAFNPNTFTRYPVSERLNRPTAIAYEPGSVFKVFSISAILELGAVNPITTFFCNGFYEHPDILEPIDCLGVHGEVGLLEIIKYSCNAGAAYASEAIDAMPFYELLSMFGFGQVTALHFPGESNGLFQTTDLWSSRTKPTLAFGQEISVTALQVVTAATVFANDGVLLEPRLIKKIVSAEGDILENYDPTPVARVISPETASAMLLMMEQATLPGGTATRAHVDGVRMSAKTGTAEVYSVESGGYSEDRFIASCLAIFPTDAPQIIVYVAILNPSAGETYGGRIAAPIVKAMAEELIAYLGVPTTGDVLEDHSGVVSIRSRPYLELGSEMPDLRGYSKRELLPLLDIDGLTVSIKGEGWVVRQHPPAGEPISEGFTIELTLE